jgi:hypothetical protein
MKNALLALGLVLLTACGGGGSAPAQEPAAQARAADYVLMDAAGEPYWLLCAPGAAKIVVYLHTWGTDFNQGRSLYPSGIAGACVALPNFNGPNNTAQALGSDDTIRRIALAILDARIHSGLQRVDMIAPSGGSLAAMNYLGTHGDITKASIWLPIYDLASLYATTQDESLKADMVAAIGHPPVGADPDYLARSPITRLANAAPSARVHLNAGSQDTVAPVAQGEAARDQFIGRGFNVAYTTWTMGHVFGPEQQREAVCQLDD